MRVTSQGVMIVLTWEGSQGVMIVLIPSLKGVMGIPVLKGCLDKTLNG